MEIKVLGAGCAKCKTTYDLIQKVIDEHHLDVTLTKVEDIMEMLQYNIMATPAIVIDGRRTAQGIRSLHGRNRKTARL